MRRRLRHEELCVRKARTTMGEASLDEGKSRGPSAARQGSYGFQCPGWAFAGEPCCHGGPKTAKIAPQPRESGECRVNLGSARGAPAAANGNRGRNDLRQHGSRPL